MLETFDLQVALKAVLRSSLSEALWKSRPIKDCDAAVHIVERDACSVCPFDTIWYWNIQRKQDVKERELNSCLTDGRRHIWDIKVSNDEQLLKQISLLCWVFGYDIVIVAEHIEKSFEIVVI